MEAAPEPMELDAPPPLAAAVAAHAGNEKKREEGGDPVTGHIISTTIGGKNGEPKRVSSLRSRFCALFSRARCWCMAKCVCSAFAVVLVACFLALLSDLCSLANA